tara:strand:+ start:640 stop:3048 length:2409 start_codon:yes stop_codon:yes gene_type:complete
MGGVAGHMAHLSEDLDLTFNEIVDILGKVANAEIENATEKVDGQNLFLTVDSYGNVRTARNKTDIGKGGMSTDEYIDKWKGHPAANAFTNGFGAITKALHTLDPNTLQDLFGGGTRYVNMEIMYPKNPNIIQYTAPHVVLHGLQYFGDNGDDQQGLANAAFEELSTAVDGAQQEVAEEVWTVNAPKIVALKNMADGKALANVTASIEAFAKPVGMDAQVRDIVELYIRQYAIEEGLPEEVRDKLVRLVLDREGATKDGITVGSLKKEVDKELRPIVSKLGTKTNSYKVIASILLPLEKAISDFAIEALRGLKSFFVDDNDKEVQRMRQELDASINHLRSLAAAGNQDMGELVDKQLGKLGDIENVASSLEGIVFEFPPGSGKIYKLTGAFAMSNQIIGRARRSGMNESILGDFTVVVSKNLQITKPIIEWLTEAKAAHHQYQKLPELVYKDILAGIPIVDIVEQKDAEKTIYNTVKRYVQILHEENGSDDDWYEYRHYADQDLGLPPEEDEDDDPVVDSDFKKTIALVPGAYKPPHQGHADMVARYAKGDPENNIPKADKVLVLISQPTKTGRSIVASRDGKEKKDLTREDSKKIWEDILALGLPNVEIDDKSGYASPVEAAYDFIGPKGTLDPREWRVILGASNKADKSGKPDWMRWAGAQAHAKEGLEVLDPEQTAVQCTGRACGTDFSATDMRDLISTLVVNPDDAGAYMELTEFIPAAQIPKLFEILGVPAPTSPRMAGGEEIEEISGMGMGSVSGASGDASKKKKRNPTMMRQFEENIDLSTVDEVIRLIMEKGIMQ